MRSGYSFYASSCKFFRVVVPSRTHTLAGPNDLRFYLWHRHDPRNPDHRKALVQRSEYRFPLLGSRIQVVLAGITSIALPRSAAACTFRYRNIAYRFRISHTRRCNCPAHIDQNPVHLPVESRIERPGRLASTTPHRTSPDCRTLSRIFPACRFVAPKQTKMTQMIMV